MTTLNFTRILKGLQHPIKAFRFLILNQISGDWVKRKKAAMDLEVERKQSLLFLSKHFDGDVAEMYREYMDSDFRRWFHSRLRQLSADPSLLKGTTSLFDCETIYLLVRVLKPEVVVETGVLQGAVSAHILEAFERNHKGLLYSIDLSPQQHDSLIHKKGRWKLIVGDSRNVLPPLLSDLGQIDLFHHDSLHEFHHMMFEFETAYQYLSPQSGVISSHDVLVPPFRKNAFLRFCNRHELEWKLFRNVGIALPPTSRHPRK